MDTGLIIIIIALIAIMVGIFIFIRIKARVDKINHIIEITNNDLEKENKRLIAENIANENKVKKLLNDIEAYTTQLEEKKESLLKIDNDISIKNFSCQQLQEQKRQLKEDIIEMRKDAEDVAKSQQELVENAFTIYCENLEKRYNEKDAEYKELTDILLTAFDKHKAEIKAETANIQKELSDAKQAKAALIEAARREKEIQDNSSFYCIEITDEDKADIARLETVKKTLNKPRVLSMLIWQTYYQKQLKTLSAQILGTKTLTGIYKITNIVTGECYIGQAVDIASRWAEHCKCGLGIDTPAGNKLYKAMQEYGLYNFAFECLEECESKKLNEREKNYIEFYQSYNYGYNSTSGNK